MAMSPPAAVRAHRSILAGSTTRVRATRHASCRHTLTLPFPILKQQERLYYALPSFAVAPRVMFPPPFASASAAKSSTSSGFKKPQVIEWKENMPVNSATFIGILIRDIRIVYLDSGKIVANSSIKVKRHIREDTWFYLEFWGDLAEVAAAHLKKDDLVFVSGCVWPEKVTGRDGLEKTLAKVVVQDLKFVLQSDNSECTTSLKDLNLEELWKNLFDNRTDWVDHRESKVSDRYPDFTHKFADIALWLENRNTPLWVCERLEKEGGGPQFSGKNTQLASTVEESWKALFADPSMWWDKRTSKVAPNLPDFRNRLSGRPLWISSVSTPLWVKSQLAALDRK
eukprot:c11187_g1_i1 orf=673-1692(-)